MAGAVGGMRRRLENGRRKDWGDRVTEMTRARKGVRIRMDAGTVERMRWQLATRDVDPTRDLFASHSCVCIASSALGSAVGISAGKSVVISRTELIGQKVLLVSDGQQLPAYVRAVRRTVQYALTEIAQPKK